MNQWGSQSCIRQEVYQLSDFQYTLGISHVLDRKFPTYLEIAHLCFIQT